MIGKIKSVTTVSALAVMAFGTMGMAQGTNPELTGYQYDYYADAAKTQYLGTVYDQGCGQVMDYVYVVRVNVPSAYFDQTAIFTCQGGQIGPIEA